MKYGFRLMAIIVMVSGFSCNTRHRSRSRATTTQSSNVVGTYAARGSGETFGKKWGYTGALVLDSTGHFGSAIAIGAENSGGDSDTERGTYEVSGDKLVLHSGDKGSSRHVLRASGDTLRLLTPWWFDAGLKALGVPEPRFIRVSSDAGDWSSVSSSTPAQTGASPKRDSSHGKSTGVRHKPR